MKKWINRALGLLDQSLNSAKLELNEVDWKEKLSENKEKLKQHLMAMSNLPGGGFLIFGIKDSNREIVGLEESEIEPIVDRLTSLGREAIEPPIIVDFHVEEFSSKHVLLIYIKESMYKPVHLRGKSIERTYIRTGGTTREASRFEVASLMLNSRTPQFEELRCTKLITGSLALELLDYEKIIQLSGNRVSTSRGEILNWLVNNKFLDKDGEGYFITNFGALSAAKRLDEIEALSRKTIRFIKYIGKNKVNTEREWTGKRGYAIGFESLISFIMERLPSSEIIENALRRTVPVYPEIAIREIVANSLVHQDLTVRGSSPMIEIFDDRIEISNPGKLLPNKSLDRLIGTSPESRNEILAKAFRLYGICEERGSGLLKSVHAMELFGLPPLKFINGTNSFKVIMYSPRKYTEMSRDERLEAVYQHSVLKFLSNSALSNKSLRERLRMGTHQRPQVSLLIKEAINEGRIKLEDPNQSPKFARYIPYWAS